MPAIGILDADLANNASGHCVVFGTIENLNTSAYSVNAPLYVASAGGLTATEPSARIQPIAQVERVNANNGSILVLTALYSSLAQQSASAVSITGGTITGLTNLTSTIGTFSTSLAVTSPTSGAFSTSADANINGMLCGRGGGNRTQNTRIGVNALPANTTGVNNTAIGNQALIGCTEGSRNVAIGHRAAGSTLGTVYNDIVAVGNDAIYRLASQITNGSVIAIGSGAGALFGSTGSNHTACNTSIFIGTDARPLGNGGTNQIVIGPSGAIGDGSNTTVIGTTSTTQSRIYGGDFFSTGLNGQSNVFGQAAVLLSAFTGATRTATALIPANCIVIGVSCRVTTAITGATSFDIGDGTTANLFADDVAVALGTTSNLVITPRVYSAATNVVCTANGGNFTAGAVRLTVHYMRIVAPTS
jgi:hypothetical protein